MNLKLGQPLPAQFLVLIGDILIILVSLSATQLVHAPAVHASPFALLAMEHSAQGVVLATLSPYLAAYVGVALLFLGTFYMFDLYDLQIFGESAALLSRLLGAGVLVLTVASILSLCSPELGWRAVLLQSVVMAVSVSYAWRRFFGANFRLLLRPEPTAVIGAGPHAERVRELMNRPHSRYRFTGFVQAAAEQAPGNAVLGSISELNSLVDRHKIRQLVLASDAIPLSAETALAGVRFRGVGLHSSSDIAMELSQSLPVELLSPSWLGVASRSDLSHRPFMRRIKRVFDVALSVLALVFFWPLLTLCAIAIRLESSGPIVFRQTRVGLHGRPFTIFKLRSMRDGSERTPQWANVNDDRITRVGHFLRRTHIDELPQLLNVLRGEMSFVGPRPERPEFVEQLRREIPFYDVRHYLMPGITGWAQVNFRYGASVADARRKLEFDLYYVLHASVLLDLLVVLKTIQVVCFLRGSR